MKQATKTWFSESTDGKLTRKELTNEIRKISASHAPVRDRMRRIRDLIEYYFRIDSNEELLNANMP